MSDRYDSATRTLNLRELHKDQGELFENLIGLILLYSYQFIWRYSDLSCDYVLIFWLFNWTGLQQKNVSVQLHRPKIMTSVVKIITEHIPEVFNLYQQHVVLCEVVSQIFQSVARIMPNTNSCLTNNVQSEKLLYIVDKDVIKTEHFSIW